MIEIILARLNSIPADKVMHFASGAVLFALCLPLMGARYAMAAVMIVGVAKEIYDSFHRETHTPDIWDAVATIAGGGVGFFCAHY